MPDIIRILLDIIANYAAITDAIKNIQEFRRNLTFNSTGEMKGDNQLQSVSCTRF
jgi:hypothetical protein